MEFYRAGSNVVSFLLNPPQSPFAKGGPGGISAPKPWGRNELRPYIRTIWIRRETFMKFGF
jgi:hypothetical protein